MCVLLSRLDRHANIIMLLLLLYAPVLRTRALPTSYVAKMVYNIIKRFIDVYIIIVSMVKRVKL